MTAHELATTDAAATFAGRAASARSVLRDVLRIREFPVLAALVALVLFTYSSNSSFLSRQGVKDLLLNATIMIILAVGQAMVIISRNVDLSVGSILGLTAFATGAMFARWPDLPIVLVFLVAMLFGAGLGAVNGVLITVARVPALVITLGTLYVYRGFNNSWAGPKQYFAGDRPRSFGNLSVDTIGGVPIITIGAVGVTAAVAVYMARTRSGRDLYAIGSEPEAARLFGVRVGRRVFGAFVANGLLAGLAGVLYTSRFNSVGATTGTGMELDVVAAAVVGGVAIFGGSGSVVGAAIGALLLTTITSSLTTLRVDKFWQQAIVGFLILAAVVADRVTRLRVARRLRTSEAHHG